MYPLLKNCSLVPPPRNSPSWYSNLINFCFSLKSLVFAKSIHAHLIKLGFNSHTFLGTRCLDLYSQCGHLGDALAAFDEIETKNTISWNICLKALLKFGHLERARRLFNEMPHRDVVGWNTLISGYASRGFVGDALQLFYEMQVAGVRAGEYTFMILKPSVSCVHHVKQIHASVIRNYLGLTNAVLGNSLIDLYGKLGLADYAFSVFWAMEERDIITWNSLIFSCHKSGYSELALHQFLMMRAEGYLPDQFTISTVLAACSRLRDLDKGKPNFAVCIKMGFLSNAIVSSAAIDLFSKCDRLEDSAQLFGELEAWDSDVCTSMISSYASHGFAEAAMQLFALMWTEGVEPTEFTFSSILRSAAVLFHLEQGCQIHSLALKLGWESDAIVACCLVDMYAKFGLVDSAIKVFVKMRVKDLISWSTVIMGFAYNGRSIEALTAFKEMLKEGLLPDQITMDRVLMGCSHGGLLDEGMSLLSSMEKEYGVKPTHEHYDSVINMMIRVGKLGQAMKMIATVDYEPGASIWGSMLEACGGLGDSVLTKRVVEQLMQLDPPSFQLYEVLARAFELMGRWEGLVRIRKAMEERGIQTQKVVGCSWIGTRSCFMDFKDCQFVQHEGSEAVKLILNLMMWEMEDDSLGEMGHDLGG